MCVSLHIDSYVEVPHTIDPSLIKADENLVALQTAVPPPTLETFPLEPATKESTLVPTTSSLVIPE